MNLKVISFFCSVLFISAASAQSGGIRFDEFSNWSQLIESAKNGHRGIFLDCYATWCGPCKKMDTEIFSDDSVALFYNGNFINVKVQFDSTKFDNQHTQEWFQVADRLKKMTDIKAYPTYLYLNERGELVDKSVGLTTPAALFVQKGHAALDTSQQYYVLRRKFLAGNHCKDIILPIVPLAISHEDYAIAYSGHNYFFNAVENIFLKQNLNTICWSISKSDDKGFDFLVKNANKVDSILQDNYHSLSIITNILTDEVYKKYIQDANKRVDWSGIAYFLEEKAHPFADRILLQIKISDAYQHKRWDRWSELSMDYYDKYAQALSHNESWFVNNILMDVFKKCNNKATLARAARLSKETIGWYSKGGEDASCMDTYANLLYKTGNVTDALSWEKRALELSKQQREVDMNELIENYRRMQQGIPTWTSGSK